MRRWLNVLPAIDAGELLRWRSQSDDGRRHAWSWLLYHWMWNTRSKRFDDFTRRLSDGEDPDAAWLAAFPDLDPARPDAMELLSEELEKYRRRGAYGYYRVRAEFDSASREVPLSRGDLHVAILEAREVAADASQQRADLQEALREEPGHAIATAWAARLGGTSPVEALRERTRAATGDGWAWLELGQALPGAADETERTAALRKAAELLPDVALAHRALAAALLAAGKAHDALAAANRALDLAPWDPVAVATLGGVAAGLGQCPQARQLASRALEAASPEGAGERLRALVADVDRRCAVTAPAEAGSPSR
ncbi:MAG TPA: hypothetical protein VFP65_02020 [Anaeromyxobacteraceae bacterium]|nr:hypothetical protein [Anaeromyxobacteraceae bacterium]